MRTDNQNVDVLIVGAGMAGLLAGEALADDGWRVVVLEKEPAPGGRLSTRRIGPGVADCGAQFITVRSPEFSEMMERWMVVGLVFEWSAGWSDGSLGRTTPEDGHPRYAIRGGMRALADYVAGPLDVRCCEAVAAMIPEMASEDGAWRIRTHNNLIFQARAVLMTPPAPVALDLLRASQVRLHDADQSALEAITFAPALAGLFWVKGDVRLPEPGAVQRPGSPITWIADNRRKGISPDATLVTVHGSPEYSQQIWKLPDREVLGALEAGLRLFRSNQAETVARQLVRWPYAAPLNTHPARYLEARDLPPLVFAGDAFGHPRVEGAALSGLAAAHAVNTRLRS